MGDLPDLLALVVRLRALTSGSLPATTGHLVHGAFMALLEARAPGWAARLHTPAPPERPFTLSGLRGGPQPPAGAAQQSLPQLPVESGARYWFRVTTLQSDLSALVLELFAQSELTLLVGSLPFQVLGLAPSTHDRTGRAWYQTLWEECQAQAPPLLLGLRFLSAATCRRQGRNHLFPEPGLIFPQLWRRWQRFCPPACRLPEVSSSACDAALMVAGYHLQTRHLRFGPHGHQLGFTGYCEYRAAPLADSTVLQLLHLLWHFSFFAGVGYGTPKGMGQVALVAP